MTGIIVSLFVFLVVVVIFVFIYLYNNKATKRPINIINVKPRRHHHHKPRIIGGCSGTRYGCCPDGHTAKKNHRGSNC